MRPLVLALALLLSSGAPVEASSWHGPTRLPWYGSQYFGNRTACGQRYTRWIVGVATWLPLRCGTIVELRWHGRTVRAPVIDRMPWHRWAVFDASAHIACELLNPRSLRGVCFTRGGVEWRIA